jgi:hypothetical protein
VAAAEEEAGNLFQLNFLLKHFYKKPGFISGFLYFPAALLNQKILISCSKIIVRKYFNLYQEILL